MAAPCVLVASCDDCTSPSSIVKRILGVSQLSDGQEISDGILAFPLHIDTKYYTAEVCLCTCQARTIGDEVFAESIQAVVLFFNTQQVGALDGVKAWLPYLEQLQPTVRLLACNQCSTTDALSRDSCLHWCLENDFELVELDPEPENTDSDDDFPETVGVERIIEALEAHLWPNMVMKDQPPCRSSYMQEMMQGHPDPVDDSPPHSLPEGKGDVVCSELSNDMTQNDSQQCGDASSIDGQLLRASPTRMGDMSEDNSNQSKVLPNVTGDNEACWDTTTSTQHPSNEMEEQLVNVMCQCGSHCGDMSLVGDTVTCNSCARSGDCQRKTASCSKNPKTTLAEKQTLETTGVENMRLFEALASEDVEDDSYEKLFESLRLMKEKADNLPDTQRKAYAEQVALSFLKAIGGNDNIDGQCDSD